MSATDTDFRVCTRCKTAKPTSEFGRKSLGRISSHCKECQRLYLKAHYQKNKDYYKAKARKRSNQVGQENRRKIIEYLSDHSCVDCGESDPRVLEFDHVRGEKKVEISVMIYDYPWSKVEAEIAKCEIRCANCHRRKTHKTRGWWGVFSRNKPT